MARAGSIRLILRSPQVNKRELKARHVPTELGREGQQSSKAVQHLLSQKCWVRSTKA